MDADVSVRILMELRVTAFVRAENPKGLFMRLELCKRT